MTHFDCDDGRLGNWDKADWYCAGRSEVEKVAVANVVPSVDETQVTEAWYAEKRLMPTKDMVQRKCLFMETTMVTTPNVPFCPTSVSPSSLSISSKPLEFLT